MTKKDLLKILVDLFIPVGFKRKGNSFVKTGPELTKLINLQQSNYGNSFYINYGYNINKLKRVDLMHIYRRLASLDMHKSKDIRALLDLENEIADDVRIARLTAYIEDILVMEFKGINSENDLLEDLKSKSDLNDITLDVKRYFNLH